MRHYGHMGGYKRRLWDEILGGLLPDGPKQVPTSPPLSYPPATVTPMPNNRPDGWDDFSEDFQVLLMAFDWDGMEAEWSGNSADVNEREASDDLRVCMGCSQAVSGPDEDTGEVLTLTVADVKMHWHPRCWLNSTNEETLLLQDKVGWMKL